MKGFGRENVASIVARVTTFDGERGREEGGYIYIVYQHAKSACGVQQEWGGFPPDPATQLPKNRPPKQKKKQTPSGVRPTTANKRTASGQSFFKPALRQRPPKSLNITKQNDPRLVYI